MRRFLALIVAVGALVVPAAASAATDAVSGIEVGFTSTEGTFTGKAAGDLPGYWKAVVDHTVLSPDATVTGGSFTLVTHWRRVVGTFNAGGTVSRTDAGANCTNQRYAVNDTLSHVGVGGPGSGTGSFGVVLTHYRTRLFGSCITYWATVAGTLSLSP